MCPFMTGLDRAVIKMKKVVLFRAQIVCEWFGENFSLSSLHKSRFVSSSGLAMFQFRGIIIRDGKNSLGHQIYPTARKGRVFWQRPYYISGQTITWYLTVTQFKLLQLYCFIPAVDLGPLNLWEMGICWICICESKVIFCWLCYCMYSFTSCSQYSLLLPVWQYSSNVCGWCHYLWVAWTNNRTAVHFKHRVNLQYAKLQIQMDTVIFLAFSLRCCCCALLNFNSKVAAFQTRAGLD